MNLAEESSCPVDFVLVNEHKVKLIALQVFLLSVFFAITTNPILIFILAGDFLLRSFNLSVISPLSVIAGFFVRILGIENIPIDAGPKKFATRMGLTFTLLIIAFWYTNYPKTSEGFTVVIALFSFAESSAGFCIGCHLYSLLKHIFKSSPAENK